nr:MAG TPA_asm: hypothetical protein [Bacteriophage sp.]
MGYKTKTYPNRPLYAWVTSLVRCKLRTVRV